MVSQGSSLFWSWVEGWFARLIPFSLAAGGLLLLLVIVGLIVFALDRQAFKSTRAWVVQNAWRRSKRCGTTRRGLWHERQELRGWHGAVQPERVV